MNIEQMKLALQARGVTAHDLEDVVDALVSEQLQNASPSATLVDNDEALCAKRAKTVDDLTQSGLQGQLEWLSRHFGNMDHVYHTLSGYLRLPVTA